MSDTTEVTKHFEALRHARELHRKAIADLLALVEREPDGWLLSIREGDKVVAEGPVGGTGVHVMRAMLGGLSGWDIAGGVGCPDKVGCTNIGQLGTKCFYLCKTVTYKGA
jgi:hypothetical protein